MMLFQNMNRIVFAGDSVTDMGRAQPLGEGLFEELGRSYVRIVENLLSTCYPEVFLRITNAGTSGNTSRDLLVRFNSEVIALQPDWISICIGINDVWRKFDSPARPDTHVSLSEYETNLEKMILMAKDKVKGIFIMSPYYMETNREDPMRKEMDQYVMVCKELSEKHGCIYIDLQAAFDAYLRHRYSMYLAWDRVHPNQVGATLIAKEFLKHCGFDYDHMPLTVNSQTN